MTNPKISRNLDEVPDEVLFTVDEYRDPAYRPRREHSYGGDQEPSTDPAVLDAAIDSEAFWLQAAAFGVAEAGPGHASCCSYLDAIAHLAQKPAKVDRRFGSRGTKTQITVGDTMRRKVGTERHAAA